MLDMQTCPIPFFQKIKICFNVNLRRFLSNHIAHHTSFLVLDPLMKGYVAKPNSRNGALDEGSYVLLTDLRNSIVGNAMVCRV